MKLIIDIPDDYVEDFKIEQKFLDNELTDNVNRYDMARYAIANGIPLDDFLKRRKEPIDRNVVDKYIAQLKKENV